MTMGYVITQAHIRAAKVKATADELPRLEAFAEMVAVLDELERSLPERVHKAQTEAGISRRPLSKAANEAISQSSDATREIDRILTRKCNRADSAQAAVKEILAIARLDMKAANSLDNSIPDDDPTKAIYSEMYWKRRELVDSLRDYARK